MANKSKITLKAIPEKGKGKSDKDVVLVIQGDLILDNSIKVRDFLVENLKNYNNFILRVTDVNSVDLSILQLLQRFIWDTIAENKSAKLELNLTQDLEKYLERSGFKPFLELSKSIRE